MARDIQLNTPQHVGISFREEGDALVAEVTPASVGAAPAVHDHIIGDVTGLQAALDGKAAEFHGHTVADVAGLVTDLAGKANTVHSHDISDVSGLSAALTMKADAAHTHGQSDVTGLQSALNALQVGVNARIKPGDDAATLGSGLASLGQVLTADGSGSTSWTTPTGGGGGAAVWGGILGTIGDQTDLSSALAGKANSSHTHTTAQITNFPTLGTAAAKNVGDFASATQGGKADTALQPGAALTSLSSGAATSGHVPKANGSGGISWAAESGGGSVAWGDVTGKPSDFPPSLHSHAAGDVTSGTLNIARIPTGTTGSTVALGNHTHAAGDISSGRLSTDRLPTSSTANRVLKVSTANSSPSYEQVDYSELSGVPSTFTPTTHSHDATDITSGTIAIARIPTGTTSSTVSLGNHSHSASSITSGTLSVTRGGTGISNPTSGSYPRGNGSSAMTMRTPAEVLSDIGGFPLSYTVNARSASYTLVASDAGALITMSVASANTLTIPTNASVAFPVGTVISFAQIGVGITTLTAASGVTLNGVVAGSSAVSKRYLFSSIVKIDTNTWLASGALADVA